MMVGVVSLWMEADNITVCSAGSSRLLCVDYVVLLALVISPQKTVRVVLTRQYNNHKMRSESKCSPRSPAIPSAINTVGEDN